MTQPIALSTARARPRGEKFVCLRCQLRTGPIRPTNLIVMMMMMMMMMRMRMMI
jgi:hypothetical protein